MSNKHTIALSAESYNRLRNCGRFGETYDDIVNRLIQQNEKVDQDREHVKTGVDG